MVLLCICGLGPRLIVTKDNSISKFNDILRLPLDICLLARCSQGCGQEADYFYKESVFIKFEPTAMEINSSADLCVCNME